MLKTIVDIYEPQKERKDLSNLAVHSKEQQITASQTRKKKKKFKYKKGAWNPKTQSFQE